MHTAGNGWAGMLVDTKLKYIQTQNMYATSKAARDICYGKDQSQHKKSVQCDLLGRLIPPTTVGERAECFDKISLFCYPDLFQL